MAIMRRVCALLAVFAGMIAPQASAAYFVSFGETKDTNRVAICDSSGCAPVKGLIVRAILSPLKGQGSEAQRHFGQPELDAARQWGANTIRFLAGQAQLDPSDPHFDPKYGPEIGAAVQRTVAAGFVVIFGLNTEPGTSVSKSYRAAHCLPTAATLRAWGTLLRDAPALWDDAHVILEPFNEPYADAGKSREAWALWRDGGEVSKGTRCTKALAVGMNGVVKFLRDAGVTNLVVIDGLGWAHYLNRKFQVYDLLDRLAYAAHPFPEKWFPLTGDPTVDYAKLDKAFGNMGRVAPVVATAVGGGLESSGIDCRPDAPAIMKTLLAYLKVRGMGAVGWAFDLPPRTLTADWAYKPTSYQDFRCRDDTGKGQGGPGEMLRAWFGQ